MQSSGIWNQKSWGLVFPPVGEPSSLQHSGCLHRTALTPHDNSDLSSSLDSDSDDDDDDDDDDDGDDDDKRFGDCLNR